MREAVLPGAGRLTLAGCVEHAFVPSAGGRLARCAACGLVATARAPRYEYDARYFTDEAGGGYDFDDAHSRAFDQARFSSELDRLGRRGIQGTLLDVGCATGAYLCEAVARGWTATGVEVAEFARLEAARRAGVTVVPSCDDLPAGRRFDLVTLHHVLEHVDDPVSFLREAIVPRVGGRLLIEVPNFDSLPSRVRGPAWGDLRLEQHVCHYTSATLSRVVEAAGLRVDRAYSLWEPLWSLSATVELGRLVAAAATGVDRRWEPPSDVTVSTHNKRGYRPPTGARRALTVLSAAACRPITGALAAAGLGARLVVEAVPKAAS